MATAGNLVFQGTAEGQFCAYDAQTGQLLWSQGAGGGVIAAPDELYGRRQAICRRARRLWRSNRGLGIEKTNVGWKWGQPRYLLVYALGGKAPPPPMPAKRHGASPAG